MKGTFSLCYNRKTRGSRGEEAILLSKLEHALGRRLRALPVGRPKGLTEGEEKWVAVPNDSIVTMTPTERVIAFNQNTRSLSFGTRARFHRNAPTGLSRSHSQ